MFFEKGIPELIEIATNKRYKENMKEKHSLDAKNGWYRYTVRFALPVYNNNEEVDHYNIFRIEMLVRHSEQGKLFLYDLVNMKNERNEHPAWLNLR